MARDHARIQVAIWRDRDWRSLPVEAQHAYLTVLSQPSLSYCGVIDYVPGKLAALSKGMTARRVDTAVRRLCETDRPFLILDDDTRELLVRTFVKHDGVLARVNMGKALGRALELVVSMRIRDAVMDELARLFTEDKTHAGWMGFAELYPMEFEEVVTIASQMTSAMESRMG